jgi:hypothetical protein
MVSSNVTNLTSALGLPNFVSTVSAGLAQDIPGLMFLSTGSPTNRAQLENIDRSIFPFAIQPGFSLANLFDASIPVGGLNTNPISRAQQPFIPGLLAVPNQANLPTTGILPSFPIFQTGAFTQGQNPTLTFPNTNGQILLGGLDPRITAAQGAAGAGLPGGVINAPAIGGATSPAGAQIAGLSSLISPGAQQLGGLGALQLGGGGMGIGAAGMGGIGTMSLSGLNGLGAGGLGGLGGLGGMNLAGGAGGLGGMNLGGAAQQQPMFMAVQTAQGMVLVPVQGQQQQFQQQAFLPQQSLQMAGLGQQQGLASQGVFGLSQFI